MVWDVVGSLIALPWLGVAAYLALLAVAARTRTAAVRCSGRVTFDVIIPAHNEESGIGRAVAGVLALAYPRELFRVVVVADNCDDRTADRAIAAGAEVLVRDDRAKRGKGYALAYAFERSLARGLVDAVVVIDADSVASPNLLTACAARIEAGAGALQADYGVRNPASSWRTRLMHLAFTAFHTVRSLARERLGLSCGLRGNGMVFTADVLRAVPHRACSIVEDLEYGIALGRAGVRVHYVGESTVRGDMCDAEQPSRSQRRRWEEGRALLRRRDALSLITEGARRRDRVLLDLAADLIVPPLGTVVAAVAAGAVACAVAIACGASMRVAPWLWALSVAGIMIYVGRALMLSGAGLRGVTDLLWAPAYVAWKFCLRVTRTLRADPEWVRTARKPQS